MTAPVQPSRDPAEGYLSLLGTERDLEAFFLLPDHRRDNNAVNRAQRLDDLLRIAQVHLIFFQ